MSSSALFKQALLSHRRSMTPAGRAQNRKGKRIHWGYPWAYEAQYAKNIVSWILPLIKATEEYFQQQGDAILRGDNANMDTLPGPGFTLLTKTLAGWIAQYYPDPSENVSPSGVMMGLGNTSAAVKKFAEAQWGKQTKPVLGFQFGAAETWWPELRDQWAQTNYKLIKTISQRYIDNVNTMAEQAVMNGWSYQTLMANLWKLKDATTGYQVKRLARDQIGKLNGQISQAQQTDAGINMYIWETAGDERVRGNPTGRFPRAVPNHYIMNGVLCRWDDASVYSTDKGKTWKPRTALMPKTHPGQDIQCRCTAIPYMDDLVNDADRSLGDTIKETGATAEPEPEVSNLITINQKWNGESFKNNYRAFVDAAAEANMETSAFMKKVETSMKELLQKSDVCVRISYGNLRDVLANGRFKNQFETYTSGGCLSHDVRSALEKKFFDIPLDATPGDRPIYGYFATASKIDPGDGETQMYGDVVCVLKRNVKNRTTVTWGDSLNLGHHLAASPANRPSVDSFPMKLQRSQRMPLPQEIEELRDDYDAIGSVYYVEGQIRGGVSAKDIDTIVFDTEPNKEYISFMKEKGIKYRVKGSGGN